MADKNALQAAFTAGYLRCEDDTQYTTRSDLIIGMFEAWWSLQESFRNPAATNDREVITTYLRCEQCHVCDGRGHSGGDFARDTVWERCSECGGTGKVFDHDQIHKLLGWEVLPHG